MLNLFNGKHRSSFAFAETFARNESCAKCPHDSGNIRSHRLAVGDCLETSKNSIIIECTTLHDDPLPKFRSIGYFDNFKQCVFDNRVGKSGRNISDGSPFFLRLFYFWVHKYGTACAKVDWMVGEQCFMSEVFHAVIQWFCKCLNERTAAGRAGFV